LPESDPYTRARAEADAYQTLIQAKITITEPTDADLREVYDRVVEYSKVHGVDLVQGQSFDELKSAIKNTESVANGIAFRNAMRTALTSYRIEVNPRYQPVEYVVTRLPVAQQPAFTAVVLPLGASTAPVIDRS
jgi:hypothetical protein